MLKIVNIVPFSMSGETRQDSEPNLAVNPANPMDMVATAFTPAPMGGNNAPLYVSTDGGDTWCLYTVIPGNHPDGGTGDITVGFATTSGVLYAGILNGATRRMQILRSSTPIIGLPMTPLGGVDRDWEDQPWIVAGSVVVNGVSVDRVFVGNNDWNQPNAMTAKVDVSQDAAGPGPVQFTQVQLEQRATDGVGDFTAIRIAGHTDGKIYAAFQHLDNNTGHIVVTRDDNWGNGTPPFAALMESGPPPFAGILAAPNVLIPMQEEMGQERLGNDLAIAVDPRDSNTVWLAHCDGLAGPDLSTLHVIRSTDGGQTWLPEQRTIANVTNPALAFNEDGLLGLAYQQHTGMTWDTKLELTSDGWTTPVEPLPLHTAPADSPLRVGQLPYLGDYIRLLGVGKDFYGVFCGNNTPNLANFPSGGITYQRAADWKNQRLLSTDGTTFVDVSIDPFFFHFSPLATARHRHKKKAVIRAMKSKVKHPPKGPK